MDIVQDLMKTERILMGCKQLQIKQRLVIFVILPIYILAKLFSKKVIIAHVWQLHVIMAISSRVGPVIQRLVMPMEIVYAKNMMEQVKIIQKKNVLLSVEKWAKNWGARQTLLFGIKTQTNAHVMRLMMN